MNTGSLQVSQNNFQARNGSNSAKSSVDVSSLLNKLRSPAPSDPKKEHTSPPKDFKCSKAAVTAGVSVPLYISQTLKFLDILSTFSSLAHVKC